MDINATPDSLRAFLDAGGDPSTLDGWESVVDSAVLALTLAPHQRLEWSRAWRQRAAAIRRGEPVDPPSRFTEADAQSCEWDAEMFDDQSLALRLIEALPAEKRVKALEELDCSRRPHPLNVEQPGGTQWSCNNCGEVHDTGDGVRAVVIGWREGWSELDYPITYCAACIGIAAQALSPAPASL